MGKWASGRDTRVPRVAVHVGRLMLGCVCVFAGRPRNLSQIIRTVAVPAARYRDPVDGTVGTIGRQK